MTQHGSKGRKSSGPARPQVHLRAVTSLGGGAADGQLFTETVTLVENEGWGWNSEGLVSPSMMAAGGGDNKYIWVHVVSLFSCIET